MTHFLTFTFHFHALEKEMATHSSVLAWRLPGTAEPDRLPSMGSHRVVGHDLSDLAAAAPPMISHCHCFLFICVYEEVVRRKRDLFSFLKPMSSTSTWKQS